MYASSQASARNREKHIREWSFHKHLNNTIAGWANSPPAQLET